MSKKNLLILSTQSTSNHRPPAGYIAGAWRFGSWPIFESVMPRCQWEIPLPGHFSTGKTWENIGHHRTKHGTKQEKHPWDLVSGHLWLPKIHWGIQISENSPILIAIQPRKLRMSTATLRKASWVILGSIQEGLGLDQNQASTNISDGCATSHEANEDGRRTTMWSFF